MPDETCAYCHSRTAWRNNLCAACYAANPPPTRDAVPLPGHPRFHELLREMAETHAKKGTDYANPQDFLSNLRKCEAFGTPAYIGVLLRLSDKWERMQNLIARERSSVHRRIA